MLLLTAQLPLWCYAYAYVGFELQEGGIETSRRVDKTMGEIVCFGYAIGVLCLVYANACRGASWRIY